MNFPLINVCRTITLLAVLLAGHLTTPIPYDFNTTTGGTGGKIKIKRDNNEEYPSIDQVATDFTNYFIRAQEGKPRDILLILDSSGSVTRPEFKLTTRGVRHVIDSICGDFGPEPAQNRLSIIQFSSTARAMITFRPKFQNREFIYHCLEALRRFRQYTCVATALRKAHLVFQEKYGGRSYTDHDTLVITDGNSSCKDNSHEASQFLQQRSIVYVVAIGMASDLQEMKNIVSDPSFLFSLPTYGDFLNMTQEAKAKATKKKCPR